MSYMFTDKTARIIISHAEDLMDDKLLACLRQEHRTDRIIQFAILHELSGKFIDEIIEICTITSTEFMDVFEKCNLEDENQMQGYSLKRTTQNISLLKLMKPFDRNKLLMKKGNSVLTYHTWINNQKKSQRARSGT